MSLKYATPRDLPSYPSAGLINPDSSAGAAASLANANHIDFESWKPGVSVSANKAAYLAKDFKPTPLWHPDPSESANQAAKLARDFKSTSAWHPETSSTGSKAAKVAAAEIVASHIRHPDVDLAGTSAAERAMRAIELTRPANSGYRVDESNKALLAATGAMTTSRKRAGSSPTIKASYPDSENSVANALTAAKFANRAPSKVGKFTPEALRGSKSSLDGGKILSSAVTNLSREMYTSHPPVAPEVEEINRQAGLRAAAVSMAKQIYEVQQRAIERATVADRSDSQYAASSVHNRKASVSSEEYSHQSPQQYINLQEAAQKLAAERLAKLQDEHAAYKNYYGTGSGQSRLSLRGLQRRRASSDGQATESDDDRSRRIRSEMSLFNSKVAHVDTIKRQKDRETLMAVAQRNVRVSMYGIDEKVYSETGKVSPAMLQSWEDQAYARAEADSKARLATHGMINLGGGKYLDQSEIDAIAAQKVQPTLDEITEKVEKQKTRDELLRLEEQERYKNAASKSQDDRERNLRTKEDWKRFKGNAILSVGDPLLLTAIDEEKREAKDKKDEEKARKTKEKELKDKEKRKSTIGSVEASLQSLHVSTLDPTPKLRPFPAPGPPELVDTRAKISDESSKAGSLAQGDLCSKTPGKIYKEASPHSTESSFRPELRFSESRELDRVLIGEHAFDEGERTALESPKSVTEEVWLASPPETTEADIAALVISSPVLLNTTSGIVIGINTDNISSIEPGKASAPITMGYPEETPSSGFSQIYTNEEAEPSTELGRKEGAESRFIQIIPMPETTTNGPSLEPKSPRGDSFTTWLKSKFSRRTSKPIKPDSQDLQDLGAKLLLPHAATHTAAVADNKEGTNAHKEADSSSVREVAMAGKYAVISENNQRTNISAELVSDPDQSYNLPLASDKNVRGRPELIRAETGSSVGEEFEEARDHFDSEQLALPAVSRGAGRGSSSPVRDSRFQENL